MGLLATGTFMIGNPTETIEDIRLTQKFIKENDVDNYGVCLTTPFPGTELWNWCEEKKLIPNNFKWSDFTYARIPIKACEMISSKRLLKLHYETAYLLRPRRSPILLKRAVRDLLKHPLKTLLKVTKHPSRIPNYFKRLKRK